LQDFTAAQQKIDFSSLHCHMAAIEALGSVNWRSNRPGRTSVVFPRASLFTRVVQNPPTRAN
jgi:hypothetical protein